MQTKKKKVRRNDIEIYILIELSHPMFDASLTEEEAQTSINRLIQE